MAGTSNGFFENRASSSLSIYNAELEPPATNYAGVESALSSNLAAPKVRISYRDSAFVQRIPRLIGLVFNWSWGATDQFKHTVSLPNAAGLSPFVQSTSFQRILIQLHNWQTNRRWYTAFPMGGAVFQGSNPVRYTYPTFRTQQVATNATGGVSTARMQPRPRFSAVQNVPKYNAAPRRFNTVSAMVSRNRQAGYSTLNGPGV